VLLGMFRSDRFADISLNPVARADPSGTRAGAPEPGRCHQRLLTGTEDRQHACVALTRGTSVNTAYMFILPSKRADPAPGPGPAPELARYDKMSAERAADPTSAPPPAAAGTARGFEPRPAAAL
jgi:hypothetical protein